MSNDIRKAAEPPLRPCPFCGGRAEFERTGTPRQSCIVVCTDCGARHESSDEGERSGWSWNRGVRLAAEQPQPEALGYATRLATSLWEKHYKAVSPHWRPLNDTLGVLTQIDNMTCRLVPPPPAAEPSEASDAEVEAAWRAIPASHEDSRVSVITKGDVWVMLRAAAAARGSK